MMAILIFVALAVNCVQVITGNKKNQIKEIEYKRYCILQKLFIPLLCDNEIWCNGSTTDFGSVSQGSNPCIPTK